jgi:nifR3 family TIM-barrel protein
MFEIRDLRFKNDLLIAPMAGISNNAFLKLALKYGASLVYKEMISDKGLVYRNQKTLKMLEGDDLYPVTLQLFGNEKDSMVEAARYVDQNTNYAIIDINMGCPVNKVVRQGSGSALMRDEDKAVDIVKGIVESVSKPVTVKMRLGYSERDMNYLSLSRKLEDVGVSAITLHGRTRSQMYDGKSDWSHVKILKDNLHIPVIGNGDVLSLDDYLNRKKETGADAIMIGRGIIGRPYLIREISNYLDGKESEPISVDEILDMCLEHAYQLVELKGEKVAIREFRGIGVHYLKGLKNSTYYKNAFIYVDTFDKLKELIENYRASLKEKDIVQDC